MRFMMFVLADDQPDTVQDDSDVDIWVNEAAGQRLMGDILDPGEARSLRVRDGRRLVTDGSTTGVTEALWGFDILDCASLDEALDLAARHPMARNGRLELRPFPDGA